MNIREALKEDWKSIWPIFHEIVKAGETYASITIVRSKMKLSSWQLLIFTGVLTIGYLVSLKHNKSKQFAVKAAGLARVRSPLFVAGQFFHRFAAPKLPQSTALEAPALPLR